MAGIGRGLYAPLHIGGMEDLGDLRFAVGGPALADVSEADRFVESWEALLATSASTAQRHRDHEVLLVTIVVLNLADLLVTQLILRQGGGREGNPAMAWLILSPWAWMVKAGIPFATLLLGARRYVSRTALVAAATVAVIYFGVVTWNVHLALSLV